MTRRFSAAATVLWVSGFLALLPACLGKQEGIQRSPSDTFYGRYLFFVSSVQGNPLCLVAAAEQMPASFSGDGQKVRWQGYVWLVFPGTAKPLFAQKGKDKGDPGIPFSHTREGLFFTSDQERFVYYMEGATGELLFLTDALFPDRARQRQEVEVRYGLQPAELYWNDRRIAGAVFYELKRSPRPAKRFADGVLEGFREGSGLYLLLSPNEEVLCVQREVDSPEDAHWLAVRHDRRGRWEETYQVSVAEGETVEVSIPGWRVSATLTPIPNVQMSGEGAVDTTSGTGSVAGAQDVHPLWKALGELPETRGKPAANFQVYRASVRVGSEDVSMSGIGMIATHP